MLNTVAVIALPGLAPFEFGVVCEIFGIDRSQRGAGIQTFDFRVCTPEPGLLPTKTGFSVLVEHDLSTTNDADLVVIVPSHSNSPTPTSVYRALQEADRRGAWIMSLCSGAFALAEAGILDGRRATTHWMYAHRLAELYPRISVDENVLYVQDGNIITSAGTAAGIDACLHLVRTVLGPKAANVIARGMVVPPHRDGGQAQYIDRPFPASNGDSMEHLLAWLDDNLDQNQTVSGLAGRMHMSGRTFARKFRAETGTTPGAWINAQRLLRAQALLEDTELDIELVAARSGFGQAVLMRHHFNKALAISPAAYRKTFRGKPLSQSPRGRIPVHGTQQRS